MLLLAWCFREYGTWDTLAVGLGPGRISWGQSMSGGHQNVWGCVHVLVRWGTRCGHTAHVVCGYSGDRVVEMQGRPDVMVAVVRDAWRLATRLLGPACIWGLSNCAGTVGGGASSVC